jgi:type III secretion system FlhB-like substrate exporter
MNHSQEITDEMAPQTTDPAQVVDNTARNGGTAPLGDGVLAREIIEAADACGTSIRDIPELAKLLFRLDIQGFIPQDIGDLLSVILSWMSELKASWDPE